MLAAIIFSSSFDEIVNMVKRTIQIIYIYVYIYIYIYIYLYIYIYNIYDIL